MLYVPGFTAVIATIVILAALAMAALFTAVLTKSSDVERV
jgi:hypothetical protein